MAVFDTTCPKPKIFGVVFDEAKIHELNSSWQELK